VFAMRRLHGLYVITDARLCPGRTHVEIARAAIEGGARIVQLRDKDASDQEFFETASELVKLARAAGVMFMVNDRVDVAAAVGADGVNVGQSDLPVSAVRKVMGPSAVVGVSAGTIEEARAAQAAGADYVGFGPVFPTGTKLDAGPVSGLETLKVVCAELDVPVVAIGGIDISNIAQVRASGAACAAVVSAVVCAESMARATAELIAAFEG
jgi:thiamine-phosphate pyrophosphorylase